jgi:hypothetical protein
MVVVKYTTDPVGVANRVLEFVCFVDTCGFDLRKRESHCPVAEVISFLCLDPSMYRNDDLFLSGKTRAECDVDHAGEK